jgi:uncharacterized protein (TIRG00374 family)
MNTKSTVGFGLSLCLGAGAIGMLAYKAGVDNLLQIMERLSWKFLLLATLFYAAAWFFRTWRIARLSLPQAPAAAYLFRIQIAGFAINAVLPMKIGDALTVLGLNEARINIAQATAIVVQLRILDLFVLLMATLPLVFTERHADLPQWIAQAIYFLGLSASLPPIFTALMFCPRIHSILDAKVMNLRPTKLRRVLRIIMDVGRSYREIIMRGRLFLQSACLTCMIWLMEAMTTAMVSLALGIPVQLHFLLPALAIANLSKAAPATPGGIGIYEGVMALILTSSGIPFDHALAIAICDHILKKTCTLGIGLPCVPSLLGPKWMHIIRTMKFKES